MSGKTIVLLVLLALFIPLIAHPQNVDFISSTLWGDDNDAVVVGNYAYCAFGSGLVVLDVSDPEAPILAGQKLIPGLSRAIDVAGNYAYLANADSSLQIVDIGNPSNPVFVGGCEIPGEARDVFVSGDYAYLACGFSGIQIVNILDPANPAFVTGFDTPYYAHCIFVSADYAYVADSQSGLQIVDVSNPANPSFAGDHNTNSPAISICVSGEYAYVAEGFGGWQNLGNIEVFDVSTPPIPPSSSATVRWTITAFTWKEIMR
jgi:hypothetical protein